MRLRIWEKALLIATGISIVIFILARTVGARVSSIGTLVSRTARPGVIFWGETVDVDLHINANALPSCVTTTDTKPIYVTLVIDHSSSMAGTPLMEARNAASDFVDLMNLTRGGDAVAVVKFDEVADLVIGFSQDRGQVVRAIQSIAGGGSTNIAGGLSLATQQFATHPIPTDARRVIILLSDGQQTVPGDPIAAADQAKAQGIRVVTIALGNADRATLAQMASSKADYYETADPATLMEIYGEIAAGMVGIVATDVILTEYFNDARFTLINTGLYRARQAGNQITWELPFVGQRGRSVGYFLQPRTLGWHRISPKPGWIDLTDCHGQAISRNTPAGPRVLVLFPLWLLYIAPGLSLLWLSYRLAQSLRKPPHRPVVKPSSRKGSAPPGWSIRKPNTQPGGADVTYGPGHPNSKSATRRGGASVTHGRGRPGKKP